MKTWQRARWQLHIYAGNVFWRLRYVALKGVEGDCCVVTICKKILVLSPSPFLLYLLLYPLLYFLLYPLYLLLIIYSFFPSPSLHLLFL